MNLFEKLRGDTARYWDKAFLKSAMAVCALTALADGTVSLSERYRVDAILAAIERLRVHDPHKAIDIMNDFLDHLRLEPARAESVLQAKVARYADDYKAARTLLRIAYLVIRADGIVSANERDAFNGLCTALAVDPEQIWGEFAAAAALHE